MKLLIVGSDKVFSIENFYVRYLKALGVDVRVYAAGSIFYDYYYRNILNKILFKTGLSGIYRRIRHKLREEIRDFRPDVIWVFKGMETDPGTLRWARQQGIKLVNYNPDNPFIFSGPGSGNQNITDSIGLYDHHFTYNLEIKRELEKKQTAPVSLLPFAYDIPDELFAACQAETEILRVCFIGNPDTKRAAFINELAHAVPVDVYGNYWPRFITNPAVNCHKPVYGDEQWKTLYKYRVQLNLMRPHNEDSHNMRTFEIPGIGGLQLAPDTAEHRLFFKDGEDIFLFSSIKDCQEKANHLLGFSSEKAAEFRKRAALHVRKDKHSYYDRAQQVLDILTTLA